MSGSKIQLNTGMGAEWLSLVTPKGRQTFEAGDACSKAHHLLGKSIR